MPCFFDSQGILSMVLPKLFTFNASVRSSVDCVIMFAVMQKNGVICVLLLALSVKHYGSLTVKTGQFTTNCKGDGVIALKRQI